MQIVKINDNADQNKILDFVHDQIFDLSALVFNKEMGEVIISIPVVLNEKLNQRKYVLVKRWDNPVVDSNLIIKNVLSINVNDKDKIGQGCINNFVYSDFRLVINNSVPVEICLYITSFEVILEITDNIIGMKSGFAFGIR